MAAIMTPIKKAVAELTKSLSVPQWILLLLFILYFIFPITFPSPIGQALGSIPGLVFVFCVVVYLFLYCHPVLGIFALLAMYEFYYKNGSSYSPATKKTAFLEYSLPQAVKDEQVARQVEMAEPQPITAPNAPATLEEEIVLQMAPIGHSDIGSYIDTQFKPVSDPVGSASLFV